MRSNFSHLLWALVRLRYRLLWAQARTSSGRIAILLMVYLLVMLVFLFFSLGGFGAAMVGVKLGRGEAIARGVLTSLFVWGIMISVVFGVGPRAAFSDVVLRRYPLTAIGRLTARHLIGLLDPVWFLLVASAIGLAIGFAVLGAGSVFVGLPAALLFIAVSYLATVLLLSLIDRTMQSGTGATVLSAVAFGLLSFSGLAISWLLDPRHVAWLQAVDRVLRFTPPGVAATLLAGSMTAAGAVSAVLLIGWCAALLAALGALERRPPASPSATSAATGWDSFYDRLAGLFGQSYAPLVGKALRYYLRCNRVRFGLVTAPIFAFLGRMMGHGDPKENFLMTLALFSFVGFAGTTAIALNQFGYDGAGIRRYAILPAPFAATLRASSFTALLIGGLMIAPTVVLWALVSGVTVEPRMIVMLLSSGVAGLFFFNALGLWTTVLSPKSVDFRSVLGNQLSVGGNIVIIGGFALVFAAAFTLIRRASFETVLAYWWVLPLLAVLCFGFYALMLQSAGKAAEARREPLIETIAGAGAH